jgi:EAL domain-containing protein (putative c-di-GMP-specific phosphodiesterase class I)
VGEGHSTIELLVATNPEFIKIAASLGTDSGNPAARSAIRAIMTFAAAQGTTVLAEGIETEEQRSFLRDLGIGLGQGYLFGRPARQLREAPTAQQVRAESSAPKRAPSRRRAQGLS